jgi:hypothetical protein
LIASKRYIVCEGVTILWSHRIRRKEAEID